MRSIKFIGKIAISCILPLGILLACAKMGMPTGGPKDITPPRVVQTTPPDSSVNFTPTKKIVITFDEYIQVKDIFQELIVSPPLKENPLTYIRNKSLVVEFANNTVFDSTTYTLNFGNSILDNNEGNILRNYEYVFSMNTFIDSMSVEGRVVNSFNHLPNKDRMFVMLYKNLNDSAPIKEKPSYICRTDDKGNFAIHNVRTGQYRLFALKDNNSDFKYNLPDEQIAFSDSILDLVPGKINEIQNIDSNNSRSNYKKIFLSASDSISKDTITRTPRNNNFYTELVYFTKKPKNQYLTNHLRELPERLQFMFNQPLDDSIKLKPLNFKPNSNWYLLDINKDNDTLQYWLTDTALASKDSLKLELRFPAFDTTGVPITSIDTLLFLKINTEQKKGLRLHNKTRTKENDKETAKKSAKKLVLRSNIKNVNAFDLNKNVEIITATPAFDIKPGKVKMFRIEDTTKIPVNFKIVHDAISKHNFTIRYKFEERSNYRIFIPDSTITDIYGATNDTTIFNFSTQAEDFYGTLSLRIDNVKEPVILQLLTEKENFVSELSFKSDTSVTFDYLYPKKYIIKLIIDSNGNGKWDTGDYLQKLQPEKVLYYPQIINIRSNWVIDNSWTLSY